MARASGALAVLALLPGCAAPTLPAFEHALAAQDSATAALRDWCAVRQLAQPARITASLVQGADAPPPADLHDLLQTEPATAIGYRHVRLSCGSPDQLVVLSEAHNWHLPGHLTARMNAALAGSDIPFGQVAAPLHFTRERLESRRGWSPGCPAPTILSHRALLRLPDGRPLALVVECYQAANLQTGRLTRLHSLPVPPTLGR